ncbi:pogo transposable element with KRAB domain [Ixodes scapularis]
MKRKGFSLQRRTGMCQKLPAEFEEKLNAFQRYVLSLRHDNNYQLGQVGNADQTPLHFDVPATTTMEERGAKQVRVLSSGHEKTRVTAMLCCTANGQNLSPYIIYKRKTLPKGVVFPSGVLVRPNKMDDHVWRRRPGASLGLRAMLVLAAFRCHLDERINKFTACLTDLVVIPGGMTSQLQPLNASLNKPVKDQIPALYTEWLVDGCHEFTPSYRMKRASLQDFTGWAKDAWCTISSAVVIKAFKKCGISNAMDGTEDAFGH